MSINRYTIINNVDEHRSIFAFGSFHDAASFKSNHIHNALNEIEFASNQNLAKKAWIING